MRPFVLREADRCRLRTAICRRTRQAAAFALGGGLQKTTLVKVQFRQLQALSELVTAAKMIHEMIVPYDGETVRQKKEREKHHRLGMAIRNVEELFGLD